MTKILCSILFCVLLLIPARAATNVCASGEWAVVNAAVTNAANGDTVLIPACNVTWANSITMRSNANIKLMGSGTNLTIVNYGGAAVTILGTNRISSICWRGTPSDSTDNFISPKGYGWRIDHCHFASATSSSMLGIYVLLNSAEDDYPWGVMDHCVFDEVRNLITPFYGSADTLSVTWNRTNNWGGIDAVVFEDCIFAQTNEGNLIDGNRGCKIVVRQCTFINAQIQQHGADGQYRGSKSWEIYGNTWQETAASFYKSPIFIRSGTGLIYSNTISGTTWNTKAIQFDHRRGYDLSPTSDGYDSSLILGNTWYSAYLDGNEAISGGAGTHTAGTQADLEDSGANWVGLYALSPWPVAVWNVTAGWIGQLDTFTTTTIAVTNIRTTPFGAVRTDWQNGDTYKLTVGYPSRDQIGRGYDTTVASYPEDGSTESAPAQQLEPARIWSNTGFTGVSVVNDCGYLIQEARDYLLEDPLVYTRLRYPHPLVFEVNPHPPPNFRIQGRSAFSGNATVN